MGLKSRDKGKVGEREAAELIRTLTGRTWGGWLCGNARAAAAVS